MGADLYIDGIFDENNKKYEKKFDAAVKKRDMNTQRYGRTALITKKAQEQVSKIYNKMYSVGYFRDSYNCWTMLRTLGLSWWNDVAPLENKKGFIKGKKLLEFKKMIENSKQSLPDKETLEKWGATVEKEGEDSLDNIHKYFKEKRQQLLDFINLAITNKKAIRCSL